MVTLLTDPAAVEGVRHGASPDCYDIAVPKAMKNSPTKEIAVSRATLSVSASGGAGASVHLVEWSFRRDIWKIMPVRCWLAGTCTFRVQPCKISLGQTVQLPDIGRMLLTSKVINGKRLLRQ